MTTRWPPESPARWTERQRQVLDLLAKSRSNQEIADELGISLDGAKWHVREIISILGVESRYEAADYWREYHGLPARLRRFGAALTTSTGLRWAAGVAAVTGVTAAGILLVVAATSGDGPVPASQAETPSPAPGETPSPAPDETPTPGATTDPLVPGARQPPPLPSVVSDPDALASGRLLVYADEVGAEVVASRRHPIVDIVTYDRDADRIVAAFRVGGADEFTTTDWARLAGRQVVAHLEERVIVANLDGSGMRTLYEPPDPARVTTLAVSPDARTVAIGVDGIDGQHGYGILAFVDIETGREVGRIEAADFRAAGFDGSPGVKGWWANGEAVEVWGYIGRGGPGTSGTVYRDGRIVRHERWAGMSADGSRVDIGRGEYVTACLGDLGWYAVTALDLLDTRSGAIERFTYGGEAIAAVSWAPDGSEFVFQSAEAQERGITPDCPDQPTTPEWKLWTPAGVLPVPDMEAIMRRWYGDNFVQVECDGAILRFDWPAEAQVPRCSYMIDPPPGTLIVGGQRVGTVTWASIVGFID